MNRTDKNAFIINHLDAFSEKQLINQLCPRYSGTLNF
nr:MAG TPA: hypothetical protein [Caudoviricetes sp.]